MFLIFKSYIWFWFSVSHFLDSIFPVVFLLQRVYIPQTLTKIMDALPTLLKETVADIDIFLDAIDKSSSPARLTPMIMDNWLGV